MNHREFRHNVELAINHAARQWCSACERLGSGDLSKLENPLKVWSRSKYSCAEEYESSLRAEIDGGTGRVVTPSVESTKAWMQTLSMEHRLWADTINLATIWSRPLMLPDSETPWSLRQLADRLLGAPTSDERKTTAAAFEHAARAVTHSVKTIVRRRFDTEEQMRDGGSKHLWVAGVEPQTAERTAVELLRRTDALPGAGRGQWSEGLHGAVGAEADEGWPARMGPDWLADVFKPGHFGSRLTVKLPDFSPPIGALSFARTLGAFGVALQDAARREAGHLAIHQHPFSFRRHERFALFTSLASEPSFAQKVLGLGLQRARTHQRRMAKAMLLSLRTDALRVVVNGTWRTDEQEASQQYLQRTADVWGSAAPPQLMGLLPQLRPWDGCRLLGAVCAASLRETLRTRFDEDWFRNPRAAQWIHETDRLAPRLDELAAERLDASLEATYQAAAEALL